MNNNIKMIKNESIKETILNTKLIDGIYISENFTLIKINNLRFINSFLKINEYLITILDSNTGFQLAEIDRFDIDNLRLFRETIVEEKLKKTLF